MGNKINIWYFSSFVISIIVAVPIITVFSSFFETTGGYVTVLKNTFLLDYIYNSLILLIGVLTLTFIIGVGYSMLQPLANYFIDLILGEDDFSSNIGYAQVLLFMLLIQVGFFELLKRTR